MPELRDPRARQRDHAHRELREHEARVLPAVRQALDNVAEGFARQVLHEREALVAQGGEPLDPLDLTALAALWGVEVPAILAALRAVFEASELETVRRFGGPQLVDAVTRDPNHPLAQALTTRVDDYLQVAGTRITAVGDTLVQAARTVLVEGNTAGEGVDEVAQRLREAFARHGQELGEVRAETIARTEVQGAWENGARDSARALPEEVRPRYKTWLATLDPRTRDSHFQVDGVTIDLDAQFEVGGVLMDGPHDPAAPPEETIRCRCVAPWTPVSGSATVAMQRRFEGHLVRIATAEGRELSATPEHPILTRRGWVAVDALKPGDQVICASPSIEAASLNCPRSPHIGDVEPTIQEVYDSLALPRTGSERVVCTSVHLDGYCSNRHVDVQMVYLPLTFGRDTAFLQRLKELGVAGAEYPVRFPDNCPAHLPVLKSQDVCLGRTAFRQVEVGQHEVNCASVYAEGPRDRQNRLAPSPARLSLRAHARTLPSSPEPATLTSRPRTHSQSSQVAMYPGERASERIGTFLHSCAVFVEIDEVVLVERFPYRGHVYDLSSPDHMYIAGGVCVHNCTLAFADDPDDVPALGENRQYKDDEAIQRVLDTYEERGITRDADTTASASTLTRSAAGSGPGSPAHGARTMPEPLPPLLAAAERGITRNANPTASAATLGSSAAGSTRPGTPAPGAHAVPEPLPPLLAAAASHTGAMVALIPSEEDAARLAVEGGEPVGQLHITLMYLGQAADIPAAARSVIMREANQIGQQRSPRQGDAFAVEVFNPGDANDKDTAIVLGLSGEQLSEMHLAAIAAVGAAGSDEWHAPEQYQPWAPHITLAYTDDLDLVEQMVDRVGPVTFDRLRVAFAGEHTDIPLEGSPMPEQDVTAADARPTRRWSTPGDTALAFEDTETGDGRIFATGALYWDNDEPLPLQYADEMLMGHQGAELAGAIEQVARVGRRITGGGPLYLDADAGTKVVELLEQDAPLGVSVDLDDVDLEVVDARPATERAEDPLLASFTGRALSVLALPDGRWQVRGLAGLHGEITAAAAAAGITAAATGVTAAAGDHDDGDGDVLLVERAGDLLLRITRGRLRGATCVSMPAFADARIVLDETDGGIGPMVTPAEAQAQVGELMAEILDYVASAAAPVRPGQVAEQLGITGQIARTYLARAVTAGRLLRPARGLYTAVQPPDEVSAAAVGNVDLPIHDDRDRDWDGQEAASRVLDWANAQAEGTDDPPARWLRQAFLHEDTEANQNTLSAYRLGFADVIDDELRIVARGVFATAGGRGVDAADIPEDEQDQIRGRICRLYERLAEALDEDLVCPWEREETAAAETITASAAADPAVAASNAELARLVPPPAVIASAWSEFQALPPLPAHWFREPTSEELPPDSGGIHVTDDGRVYGWVAQRGVPHEALGHTIDEIEPIDTTWFLRQKFRLDDRTYTTAGPYVMNVGHHRDGGNCETQACLWDDSRTIAGVVTVGMNDGGMWFSGAAAPWLSDWDQMKLRVCQPSYHMVKQYDGTYKLGAVLAVQRPAHGSRLITASVVERSNLVLMPAAAAIHASHSAAAPVVLAQESVREVAVEFADEMERRERAKAEAEAMRVEMEALQAEFARAEVAALQAEIEGGS